MRRENFGALYTQLLEYRVTMLDNFKTDYEASVSVKEC